LHTGTVLMAQSEKPVEKHHHLSAVFAKYFLPLQP